MRFTSRITRGWRAAAAALGIGALVLTGAVAVAAPGDNAANAPFESLYTSSSTVSPLDNETASLNLGTKFTTTVDGYVNGVEFFREAGATSVTLYGPTGTVLATSSTLVGSVGGWATAWFKPVRVTAGTQYTASEFITNGRYHGTNGGFDSGRTVKHLSVPAAAGVYTYSASAARPVSVYQNSEYFVSPVFVPDVQPGATTTVTAPGPTTTVTVTASPAPTTTSPAPSPTPTTTSPAPSPTPTTTTTTAPPPPPSGYPDASNTGVPAGVTLTPMSGTTFGTPGQVINGRDISGCVTVTADNVTIRNSRIRGVGTCGGSHVVHVAGGVDNLLIEDTEIDGLGQSRGSAIGNSGFTLNRVEIHNVGSDGVYAEQDVTITNSWIHDLIFMSGDHNDTIMTNGNMDNVLIKHNRLENEYTQTAVIALFEDFGGIFNVLVEDNILAGGGYTVYAGGNTSMPHGNIRFVNNKFSKQFYPNGGFHGPVTARDSTITWTGNVWLGTNDPVG